MSAHTIESLIGNTPLVELRKLPLASSNRVLVKLEGTNPGGSVKDRPARNMIVQAERRGAIKQGDSLIEATSGNTGIALAMVAAAKGYKMILIMPDNMSEERKAAMSAYGAELILVSGKRAWRARVIWLCVFSPKVGGWCSISLPISTTPMRITREPVLKFGEIPRVA
jgi:cysteine synthase